MRFGEQLRAVRLRWAKGWADALASAIAASLAWALSSWLFGHRLPIFACVAAVVCLAPGVPSRPGQAVNMMLGLVTGIIVGEVGLAALPEQDPALLIPLVVFLGIMTAISFGLQPVIAIQGGLSALLVLAMGPATAGASRLSDAMVGTSIALIFSQVLITPDPLRLIREAADALLGDVAAGLVSLSNAVGARDSAKAAVARTFLLNASESANLLEVRVASARSILRWSLRGRIQDEKATAAADLYNRRGAIVYASALVLADTLTANLEAGREPPPTMPRLLAEAAALCQSLADGSESPAPPGGFDDAGLFATDWHACLDSLDVLQRQLLALRNEQRLVRSRPLFGRNG